MIISLRDPRVHWLLEHDDVRCKVYKLGRGTHKTNNVLVVIAPESYMIDKKKNRIYGISPSVSYDEEEILPPSWTLVS